MRLLLLETRGPLGRLVEKTDERHTFGIDGIRRVRVDSGFALSDLRKPGGVGVVSVVVGKRDCCPFGAEKPKEEVIEFRLLLRNPLFLPGLVRFLGEGEILIGILPKQLSNHLSPSHARRAIDWDIRHPGIHRLVRRETSVPSVVVDSEPFVEDLDVRGELQLDSGKLNIGLMFEDRTVTMELKLRMDPLEGGAKDGTDEAIGADSDIKVEGAGMDDGEVYLPESLRSSIGPGHHGSRL